MLWRLKQLDIIKGRQLWEPRCPRFPYPMGGGMSIKPSLRAYVDRCFVLTKCLGCEYQVLSMGSDGECGLNRRTKLFSTSMFDCLKSRGWKLSMSMYEMSEEKRAGSAVVKGRGWQQWRRSASREAEGRVGLCYASWVLVFLYLCVNCDVSKLSLLSTSICVDDTLMI